jgi:prephenate dehydrogenase
VGSEVSGGDFRRVGIVGIGLVGGSLAFAIRRALPDTVVVGVDRDDVTSVARQLGAIHQAGREVAALAGCDLVVLAAPVRQNVALLEHLGTHVTGPAIVTDVGSTKRSTVEAARALPASLTFIGGHPLAGAARGGLEASRADLFERRAWLLTPDAGAPPEAIARLSGLVAALGATPVLVDPVTHDRVLAYTSHLPQLTASALMHVVGESVGDAGLRLSGAGLADTTRVAASPASIWSDICATNEDELLPALDRLIATLQELRSSLADDQSIAPLFESAQRWRARLK